MARYASVLDLIGNTPMVDISQLSPNPRRQAHRQARGPEPRRLGQGPGGQGHDRGGREGRLAAPGPGDPRVLVGQHRDRPGHDRQGQGLPVQDRAPRQRVGRAPPEPRGVGRRDHPVRRGRRAPTARCAGPRQLAEANPDWWFPYQYGNHANPKAHYESTGSGDLAGLPRDHPLRRRPRHRRER